MRQIMTFCLTVPEKKTSASFPTSPEEARWSTRKSPFSTTWTKKRCFDIHESTRDNLLQSCWERLQRSYLFSVGLLRLLMNTQRDILYFESIHRHGRKRPGSKRRPSWSSRYFVVKSCVARWRARASCSCISSLEGGRLARDALNNFTVTLCMSEYMYVYGMCNRAKQIGSNLQWWRKL
jgi:hypothetical protein